MDLRRSMLIGSVSLVALAFAATGHGRGRGRSADHRRRDRGHRHPRIAGEGDRDQEARPTNQVDAISATDIGKLPDKNVADALQRIPGVNTNSAASGEGGFDENDRVSIRGTSPSLTQVTVDGHSVATGDWFILDQYQTVGRSVSFTLLPAEIVDTAVVYKTQDASLLEGGVAGVGRHQSPASRWTSRKPCTVRGLAEAAYNTPEQGRPSRRSTAWSAGRTPTTPSASWLQGFYEERSVERLRPGNPGLHADHQTRRCSHRRGRRHARERHPIWSASGRRP